MTDGPLTGVRVLDLSRLLPGPACTWYLQGLGASVDRVETPGVGDWTRHVPPFIDGAGAIFASVSRGKRSLGVNLRSPRGPATVEALLPHYDVLVEGFKPGVMEAMGLAPRRLVTERPGLVVARVSGFGQTGPWSRRPGHDINYVGATSILSFSARGPDPVVPPVQIADLSGAMIAAMGISAALFDSARSGRGRVLDVSMTEAALSLVAPHVAALSTEGRSPRPGGEMLTGALAVYGTYACADGKWLTLGALEPKFQAALQAEVGAIGLEALRETFAQRPRDEWVERLTEACAGPVLEPAELADFAPLAARGAVERLGQTTFVLPPLRDGSTAVGPVPSVGQHTDEILTEGGFSSDDIAQLRDAGAVG